jgi:hypothetical protein
MDLFGELHLFLNRLTADDKNVLPPHPSSRKLTRPSSVVRIATADLQYNLLNLVFSWFALANLWLTFSIVIELVPTSTKINIFVTADIVSWWYLERIKADKSDSLGQPGSHVDIHGVPHASGQLDLS